jgi:polysaccharide deacetylase family protein (PEP-CTERM system associated)
MTENTKFEGADNPQRLGGHIFSIDVEEWFHVLDIDQAPAENEWEHLPARLQRNFLRMLDLFDERQVKTTCFFLGWAAKRYPALVREATARGHEIASHGLRHTLIYTQSPVEFLADARESRLCLEDISGAPVRGYRAAGFSVTEKTPWFFDQLVEAGYQYDASVFPASRGHGGLPGARFDPHYVQTARGRLFEFPVSMVKVGGRPMYFFGGGYLRLFPLFVVRKMAERINADGRPVTYYLHPREIDPGQPRISMGMWRRFKTYVNLSSTEEKIRNLLMHYHGCGYWSWLERNREAIGG